MAYNTFLRDSKILYAMLNDRDESASAFAIGLCASHPELRVFAKCNHQCSECYLKRLGNEFYRDGWRRVPDDAKVISWQKMDEYKERAVQNALHQRTRYILRTIYKHNEEVNGGIGNDFLLDMAEVLGMNKGCKSKEFIIDDFDDGRESLFSKPSKTITNGEWLRGLSDEEFLKWVNRYPCQQDGMDCGFISAVVLRHEYDDCDECLLAWLRAEHKGVE